MDNRTKVRGGEVMAIELHHLHPSHDDEVARLKARIAELEKENQTLAEDVSDKIERRIDCYGSVTGKINFCPMCGRPLNKTFPNELKADEKLCIKYEKECIDECRKNENKIISYTAISSEKVEELESLIRSAENIFDVLSKRGIILMWNKFTDHYSVMVKDK